MKKLYSPFFLRAAFVVLFMLSFVRGWGQISNYTFSQSNGTYTAITGGTAHTAVPVYDVAYNFALPFNFNYNGTNYTVARPTTNGFLVLGGSAPSPTQYFPLSSGATNFAISAYGGELRSVVRSEVLGVAPNRIYVCQWSLVDRWAGSVWQADQSNFQIRLYETSNVIEVVYGANTPTAVSSTLQVGLRGSVNTDFNNRTTTTNWASTTAGTNNTSSCTFSSTVKPTSGLIYTWAPATCSGTPAPGNTVATPNSVVSGGTTVLSLQNATAGSGVTYQWQSSSDGVTFGNISLATASTYTATVTAKTWYQCIVTCSGNNATSTPVVVNLTYCSSTYTSGPGTTGNDRIANVTLGTLNNTTGGATTSPYYTFYDSVAIPNISQSSTATVLVTVGADPNQFVGAWIDFNQNGIFESTEGLVSENVGANGLATFNFSVPAGAILGNTRMRIRGGNDTALTTSQACGTTSSAWGETEDYIVNITSAGPTATVTISAEDYNSAPTDWFTNSTNNIFYWAAITPTGGSALLNSVTANMSGTYLAADIPTNGLKLYYSSDFDLTPAGDVLLASRSSTKAGATENITWNSLTGMPTIAAGVTGYIYAVADIAGAATPSKTVAGTFGSNSNITFSATVTYSTLNTYGSTVLKTIVAAPPATYTWNGSSSNSWDTAANWTKSGGGTGVPTSIDNVIINVPGGSRLNITSTKSVKDFTLSGTGNFDMSASGILTITGNVIYDGAQNAGSSSVLNCSSTVNITSASAQDILPLRYGSLNASGGNRTLIDGKTTAICDLFNTGAGAYTVVGSTVEYYSPSTLTTYTMSSFTYHNLTFTGAATFGIGAGNIINVQGNYVQSGSGQVIVSRTGAGTLNISGNATVSNGILDISFTNNAGVFSVGQDLSLSGTALINVLNGTPSTPTTTVTIGRDLFISGTARLKLEPLSSTNGNAIVNVGRDFSGTATGPLSNGMVDFGLGSIAGNAINIGRNFSKSGIGEFWTSSANKATGFVMKGGTPATPTTFSYTGETSYYTSYVIGDNAYVQLLTDLTLGLDFGPRSFFTVNATGSLDFADKAIIGNEDTRFYTNNGSTLITSNANGFGGTTTTGSLRNFISTGTGSTTNGRAHLVNGVNYVFNGNTTSPFPTTTFGNLGSLTINNSQVVSNRTDNLTVINNVNINANSGFTLNPTSGNLILGGLMTIENNAFFDNAGENQITQGGSGSILVKNGGRFITKDEQGFSGTNAAIPTITNISLETTSIVEYARAGAQTVTNGAITSPTTPVGINYQNLEISGSGIKTVAANTLVNNITKVTAAELLIKKTDDLTNPVVFTAKNGLNVATGATFRLENNAQLMQDEAATANNEGSIIVERDVTDMDNVLATQMDYIYWSSPVADQPTNGANAFSPGTSPDFFFDYKESDDKFYPTPDTTFQRGKGYAVGAEVGVAFPTGYDATYRFTGKPNNGAFNGQPLLKSATGGGYNLVGNPYPSNIDLDKLFTLNSDRIASVAFMWVNTGIYTENQMGSGYAGNNYSVYNEAGGTPATAFTVGFNAPTKTIKVGQGFIVESKTNVLPLKFDHSIRDTDKGTGFYQKANEAAKNRFWLQHISPETVVNTMLVGYFDDATAGFDKNYDAELFSSPNDVIYSVLNNLKLLIQGKNIFNVNDKVSLGTNQNAVGNYRIKLAHKEGIFENGQAIYLHDKLNNTYTNLQETDFTYAATKGATVNRFEIVYEPSATLGTGANTKESIQVYRNGDNFVVKSGQSKIDEVEVFDASGRLFQKVKGGSVEVTIPAATLASGIYILKISRSNETIYKKIIK